MLHKLCFENWFSNVPLKKLKIKSIATVPTDTLKTCEFSSAKIIKIKGIGNYEDLSTSIDKFIINAIRWYDNKAVDIVTTFHEGKNIDKVKTKPVNYFSPAYKGLQLLIFHSINRFICKKKNSAHIKLNRFT